MSRARGLLGLLGCVVLALVLAAVTPDPAVDARRRWTDGSPGERVATPDVSVLVGQVAVVRTADPGYGEPLTTQQALVVTEVDVQVRHRQASLGQVYLQSRDGRQYEPRSEFLSAGLSQTPPGFTRHATLVFEVPTERLARSRLVVDADAASVDGYAHAIRVDLGLRGSVEVSPETVSPEESTVTTT